VAVAPVRARRPGAAVGQIEPATPAELEECPFCAGHEDRTPPHTLVLPSEGPWQVRVVPNLYPALDRQEVVVHVPRHARSLGELSDAEANLVAGAWRRRRAAEPAGYLHAFVNEGRDAGSSLPHTHSQLAWLPGPPPETRDAVDRRQWSVVDAREGVTLACPYVSRVPYECVIAPSSPHPGAFAYDLLEPAVALLADAVRRLHSVAGPSPLNAWLHDGEDWHLELMPRLSVLAGLELGAGVYVNTVPPEEAATRLRAAHP
jgi:UDPglucose--hexose-1-phosphate uridylyltransferase